MHMLIIPRTVQIWGKRTTVSLHWNAMADVNSGLQQKAHYHAITTLNNTDARVISVEDSNIQHDLC